MTNIDNRIYGDVEFCIRVSILDLRPGVFGTVAMEFGHKSIGSGDEPVFLLPFHNALLSVVRNEGEVPEKYFLDSTKEMWEELKRFGQRFQFPSVEGFDEFDFLYCNNGEQIRFLWKQRKDEDEGIHDAIVDSASVRSAFESLQNDFFPQISL